VRATTASAGTDPGTMVRGAVDRRLLLWVVVLGFCTLGMVNLPYAFATLPVTGKVTYFQAILLVAAALGAVPLVRIAAGSERSLARTLCRIVMVYLLFELLVVIPVAIWLGTAKLTVILGGLDVRVSWMLVPVMLVICSDERARRIAGRATVIAAVCLIAWGVFAATTGRGGYYVEFGDMRYRVLQGQGSLLFAWPFMLAVAGAASRRYTAPFLALAAAGLVFTNHRSDLIAFAAAAAVCLIMSGQLRRVLPALAPIALVSAVVALVWERQFNNAFGYTLSHLFDISSGNGADRMMRWRLAWEWIAAHPFNDFVWSWRYYLTNLSETYQPHNFALEIGGEEGVAGVAFYGSTLWIALRGAWGWGRRDAQIRALIGWLVFYIIFSLMNANHYLPTSMPMLVAAVAALASRADQLRLAVDRAPALPLEGPEAAA
jgi:hypothetical protein